MRDESKATVPPMLLEGNTLTRSRWEKEREEQEQQQHTAWPLLRG